MFQNFRRFVGCATMVGCVFLGLNSPGQAQDEPPPLRQAVAFIKEQGRCICMFAFPQGPYHGIEYDGCRKLKNGYELKYTATVAGTYTGIKHLFTIACGVDEQGKVVYVNPVRWNGNGTPFTPGGAYLQELRSIVSQLPGVRDDIGKLRQVGSASARELCEIFLQHQ